MVALFDLIPLPFGGYFFLTTPPEYSDVESTLSVFMVVTTLMFSIVVSALMGDLGSESEVLVKYWYQATAAFGYLVLLILITYMYFSTHVHQDNPETMKAEMQAFMYPWAILMTSMQLLFVLGTTLLFYGLSYARDDRYGAEIADELYVGNAWQNAIIFSLIVFGTHMAFLWVQKKSKAETIIKSGSPTESKEEGVSSQTGRSGSPIESKEEDVSSQTGTNVGL